MLHEPEQDIVMFVRRSDPTKGKDWSLQKFIIPTTEPLSVMTLLAMAHEIAPDLACRTSTCFKGKCGSCLVRVNGRDVLGCVTLVKPGGSITVDPYSKYKVIRDVAVDFERPVGEEA